MGVLLFMRVCVFVDRIGRDSVEGCRWRATGWGQFPAGSRLLLRLKHVNFKECTAVEYAVLHHTVTLKQQTIFDYARLIKLNLITMKYHKFTISRRTFRSSE